ILYKAKQIGYKIVIWLAAKKAKRIITVSQFSKQEIVKHFKLKDEKVVVTYEACDPPKQVGGAFTNIAERFKITKPFLLYVGNTYPHKNLERLVHAFRKLRNEEKIDVQLVLVGKRDYFSERLEILVNEQGMKRDVIFPGFVKDEELPLFYRSALLYVFPSSIEGFGLPPLEAMSYDLPVVSSNAPCMPEILGEAAKYFHPDEISDIVQVLKQVIQDKQMRENLREKGREHIKKFSWRKMVEKTHSIYVRELF
ncbi:glycosyltransferase family 4 protein, partial [Patescibacteria group bacterium]|nr:glycosyltransferase family 4 protein [Patescibacteria group bacterium]